MQKNTFFRRAAALLLTAVLAVSAALPGLAVYEMPIQTANEGESVYLFNADIDKPILEQNIDQQRYIASLTKMMTALLFLESGKDLNAEITIPTSLTQEFKDIQNANGSTMNLRIGETCAASTCCTGFWSPAPTTPPASSPATWRTAVCPTLWP